MVSLNSKLFSVSLNFFFVLYAFFNWINCFDQSGTVVSDLGARVDAGVGVDADSDA